MDDFVPRVFRILFQCGAVLFGINEQGVRDARRQVLRLLQVLYQKHVILVPMRLVELRFCVGVRARVRLGLGADELARLAEHQIVGAAMRVLVHATVAALRRLAVRWLEELEHIIVALCVLQLLFDVHFLAHCLLIVADAGPLVGDHLQVRALGHPGGFDDRVA